MYISPDNDGQPRLQVIDGAHATGIIDPITYLLREGYAVLERDPDTGRPVQEAYLIPHATYYYNRKTEETRVYEHPVDYPLLVPIIYRPDNKRPFGHSRISRACMDAQNSAARTLKRSEITAEFYSFPQKYVTGLSQEAPKIEAWRAAISTMLAFEKDDTGEAPKLGQFNQQSVEPHISQLKMFASVFAGETGLTLEDLGFTQDNPSSVEAIKASHENLRLTARKAQRTFGVGFLNAGYLAACLRDEHAYKRKIIHMTKPVWEPIFEPDLSAISLIGDGAIKINQAVPGYFNAASLRDLTGIAPAEG